MYDKFYLHSKGENNIESLFAKEMETIWFGLLFFNIMASDIHLLMVSFFGCSTRNTLILFGLFSA